MKVYEAKKNRTEKELTIIRKKKKKTTTTKINEQNVSFNPETEIK